MSDRTAVVVGLCPHGLALSRSLHRSGIRVVALEAQKALAGTRTNTAEVVYVGDINGPALIDSLISLAPSISENGPPVLFLTNDTMVATVGSQFPKIRTLYELSWGLCSESVLPLLRKEMIERRCREVGILHPRSQMIREQDDVSVNRLGLQFPIILKPDRPVSAFKTLVLDSYEQVSEHWPLISQCLPVIAQEFIPGGDGLIQFGAVLSSRRKNRSTLRRTENPIPPNGTHVNRI